MKRYIVFPGYVKSKNDEQWHYISALKLIELYHTDIDDCFLTIQRSRLRNVHGIFGVLKPDETGKYDRSKCETIKI